jgi:hypothetical protein
MGIDYHTHVGPYIRVKNTPTTGKEEYFSCPNSKCLNHQSKISDKFCGKCGSQITLISKPTLTPVKFDVYDETNEELRDAMTEEKPGYEGYEFFVTNLTDGIGKSFNPKYEHYIFNTTSEKVTDELKKFKKVNKKHIDRIEEVFGKENVEVEWGVLGWMS